MIVADDRNVKGIHNPEFIGRHHLLYSGSLATIRSTPCRFFKRGILSGPSTVSILSQWLAQCSRRGQARQGNRLAKRSRCRNWGSVKPYPTDDCFKFVRH